MVLNYLRYHEDAKRTKTPYIILFAQDHAIGFYEKLGFEVISEGEMEANIRITI